MASLEKINILLDELQQTKQRLKNADQEMTALELDVLKSNVIELYREILKVHQNGITLGAQPKIADKIERLKSTQKQEETRQETQQSLDRQSPKIEQEVVVSQNNIDISKSAAVAEDLPSDPIARAYAQARKKAADYKTTTEPAQQHHLKETSLPQPVKKDERLKSQQQPPIKPMPTPEVEPQPNPNPEKPGIRELPTPQIPTIPQPEPLRVPEPEPFTPEPQRREREPEPEPAFTKSASQTSAATKSDKISINDRFAQGAVKRNLADKLKLSPINDLRTAIGLNQKVGFIKELFNGEDKEYKRVIQFLNACKNFSEAKYFLSDEIGPQYNWDDENPKIQEFMELVYRKFL